MYLGGGGVKLKGGQRMFIEKFFFHSVNATTKDSEKLAKALQTKMVET